MRLEQALAVSIVMSAMALPAWATKPTPSELARASDWAAARFGDQPSADPPFSFTYDGKPSSELLKSWKTERQSRRLDETKNALVTTYTEPTTGLVVTCRAVTYRDFPTVEWVVHLKNTGQKDTPILENIQALDIALHRGEDDSEFVLHHNQGSLTAADDFQPFVTPLPAGKVHPLGTSGGRPMNVNMPYFNLQWGQQGLIVVLSWVGQWAASFNRDAKTGLRIIGGQEQTHFTLHPGEEVRTPLVALQFYEGPDRVRSQNIWRRWMIAHNLPQPGGKPFPPVMSASSLDYYDSAGDEITMIKACTARGLKFDYWWRDAGWYPCGNNWWSTGTWVADPSRYPQGLREVADAAHAAGMKLTVWFEPERAVPGSALYKEHPEWLFGPAEPARLIDLGNPEAFKWLVETLDRIITENHIDMYRQDYNFDPLGYWRYQEPENRQGITEIRQIVGLLAFWDELQRRHPEMPFDNCASGGRRNVLEMMRRGVPLSKTDHAGGTISSQCQLHGLAPWLPYFGAGCQLSASRYVRRSNIAPWVGTAEDVRKDTLDYADIRAFMNEWREVVPYYWGDFYPLTPYSLQEDAWMAWQFDVPEKGEGLIQVFRREKNAEQSRVFKLRGLEPQAEYVLKDRDTGKTETVPGQKLMDEGLRVSVANQPDAVLITYRMAG